MQLITTNVVEENLNNININILPNCVDNISELLKNLREQIEAAQLKTRTDDSFLLRFLSTRKYNVEAAFKLVKNYEDYKIRNADFLQIPRSLIRKVLKSNILNILCKRDINNRRVFWMRMGLWKPNEFSLEAVLQVGTLLAEAAMLENPTASAGVIAIFDLQDVTLSQIREITPSFARRYVNFTGNCLPIRLLAAHVINANVTFSILLTLFKRFLNEKAKKRLFFHGQNLQSLHKYVSQEVLPIKLGGVHDDNWTEIWLNILENDAIDNDLKKLGYIIDKDCGTD